jgi:hypothetical protein
VSAWFRLGVRVVVVALVTAGTNAGIGAGPVHASLHVFPAAANVVTSSQQVVTASVSDLYSEGTYDIAWRLEADGAPIGPTGTKHGRVDNHAAPFQVDGTALTDGTYDLLGTIDLTLDAGGVQNAEFSGQLKVDRTGPAVTSITVSRPTIYPMLQTAAYPGSVVFTLTGDIGSVDYDYRIEIAKGAVKPYAFMPSDQTDGRHLVTWSGDIGWTGPHAPPGIYTLAAYDQYDNPSAVTAQVTVSSLHFVSRVFKTTVTARRSLENKFVGKCATLRSPSLHRWKGSLGLYTNTKCKSRSFQKSGVQTVHSIKVPASAGGYGAITVDTYGGAASSRRRSTVVVAMVSKKNKLLNRYRTKSKVGRTNAYSFFVNQDVVWPDHTIAWVVAPARPGDRYDLRSFVVTVKYASVAY